MNDTALLRAAEATLDDAGLRGSVLVRDLRRGEELSIEPDLEFPAASLVKVPLAVVTLERIQRGELDAATAITVQPSHVDVPGPTGLSKFRHPATIALGDLLYLSTAISDSVAADALLELTPPEEVTAQLRKLGIGGINLRHFNRDLVATPAERFDADDRYLAHSLAINAGTAGRGHRIAQLDVTRANSGTARAFVELLQALWTASAIDPLVAQQVRGLMADTVHRQRLAPDFSSDASRWSSKTGTLLNLRHEIGVVEHANGEVFAVAVLTESRVAAVNQPAAEATMARVARMLRDHLRRG